MKRKQIITASLITMLTLSNFGIAYADTEVDESVPTESTQTEESVTVTVTISEEVDNGITVDDSDKSNITSHGEFTADSKENVEEYKTEITENQEQLKSEIEAEGGTFEYEISVDDKSYSTPKTEEAENKDAAEARAEELGGTVKEEKKTGDTQEESKNFTTEDAAMEYVNSLLENENIENVNYEITLNPETVVPGTPTANLIEENGYHKVFNKDGSITIVVTGGLEEITITLEELSETLQPGDKISQKITFVNESGDKYEIESYTKASDGPYKYVKTNQWKDSLGTVVGTLCNGAYTYFIPADYNTLKGGASVGAGEEVFKWYCKNNNKDPYRLTGRERNEIAAEIAKDNGALLLKYYNEVLNPEEDYADLYEAWVANFRDRLWTTTFDGVSGDEYFKNFVLEDENVTVTWVGEISGPGTDNYYQCSVWGIEDEIILKIADEIIPASYTAEITYNDVTYKYTVEYDETTEVYDITVDGHGSIPVKIDDNSGGGDSDGGGDDDDDYTPIPKPTPEPITDPIPQPEPTPEPEPAPLPDPVVIPIPEPTPEVIPPAVVTPGAIDTTVADIPKTGDGINWLMIAIGALIGGICGAVEGIFRNRRK